MRLKRSKYFSQASDEAKRSSKSLKRSLIESSCSAGVIRFQKSDLLRAHFIAQISKSFIILLLQKKQETFLLVVDQHAAHERVNLEKRERQLLESRRSFRNSECSDENIFSVFATRELVRVSIIEKERLLQYRDIARSWGWEYTFVHEDEMSSVEDELNSDHKDLHRATTKDVPPMALHLLILQVPIIYGRVKNGYDFLEQFIEQQCNQKQNVDIPECILHNVKTKACHTSIRFGDILSRKRCKRLVVELAETKSPFICAHGRPTVIPLNWKRKKL